MIKLVADAVTDPTFMVALVVSIAVFVTVLTLLPSFSRDPLKVRMKSVALERDELRAQQRARLAAEADRKRHAQRRRAPRPQARAC
jgi:tight adherence protein C